MVNEYGIITLNNSFGNDNLIGTAVFPFENGTGPRAFINLIFLPKGDSLEDMTGEYFAYDQIDDNGGVFDHMTIDSFEVPTNGYVVVYLSTEGGPLQDVFFDDLQITLQESPVIQADAYYPFGLTFNSYQRVTSKQNDYLYNGKERQDELDLNWLDYGARMYDPAIGRWLVVDPLAAERDWLSPYQYVQNNPIIMIDPEGMLDDYFDQEGNYLGKDEAETDAVKIVNKDFGEVAKTVNKDGTESILHEEGKLISTVHSKAYLSVEASLNIYDHCNSTNLPSEMDDLDGGAAARFFTYGGEGNEKLVFDDARLKETEISDHANELKSVVTHEDKHYKGYKEYGRKLRLNLN